MGYAPAKSALRLNSILSIDGQTWWHAEEAAIVEPLEKAPLRGIVAKGEYPTLIRSEQEYPPIGGFIYKDPIFQAEIENE